MAKSILYNIFVPIQIFLKAAPMSYFFTESITKHFDQTVALDDLSIQVKKGEWMAILGESGSGKSTMLRILGRFIQQDSGQVTLNKRVLPSVLDQLIPGLDEIKLVHQEFDLFPNQTVRENIAYPLRFHTQAFRDQRVAELLEITQLYSVASKKAKLLSGGEKQRTAIAKSIAELPAVLLMDEPFAHLDFPNRNRLSTVLTRLKHKEKLTCVFVTHDTADALAWAETVVVLKKGRIIQTGTPWQLYHTPVNAYVAELTGSVNWINPNQGTFIRPEKLHITHSSTRSKWSGKVLSVRFRGKDWEYTAEDKNKSIFTFYRSNARISVGETVNLTYAEREIVAVQSLV